MHFKYLNSNLEIIDVRIPNRDTDSSAARSSTSSSNKSNKSLGSLTSTFLSVGSQGSGLNRNFYLKARRSRSRRSSVNLDRASLRNSLDSKRSLITSEIVQSGKSSINHANINILSNETNELAKSGANHLASPRPAAKQPAKQVSIASPEESSPRGRKVSILTALDGMKKQMSSNATLLRAREHLNQYQRLKNDKSINIMLITVSIAFLLLTFPYQIIWIVEKLYLEFLSEKQILFEYDSAKKKELFAFRIITSAMKDLCLVVRNLNFSINFFLYSTMSNLFRQELNKLFQRCGLSQLNLFKNSITTISPVATEYTRVSKQTRDSGKWSRQASMRRLRHERKAQARYSIYKEESKAKRKSATQSTII